MPTDYRGVSRVLIGIAAALAISLVLWFLIAGVLWTFLS